MTAFISWYLLVTLLGWLTFPLAYRLFPALADRAYSLSRTLGLLLWGFLFWLMASLGIAQNDTGGLLLALTIVIGLSIWAIGRGRMDGEQWSFVHGLSSLREWVRSNKRLIISTEILFFLAFGFVALMRAAGPDITGTEKPMELAFINAILRSPTFPPNDPWLSGYAISYYYFGYVMAAMLAKLTAVPGSVAFNLMLSLVFALAAIGAYGVVYNLLVARFRTNDERGTTNDPSSVVGCRSSTIRRLAFLGPLFLLLVSNLEGFLEMLHSGGVFWKFNGAEAASRFWNWLDIKDLSSPPIKPLDFIPDRYLWWWRASRVVQDFDLAGGWHEIIDEFPFFSFLLGDLHPHVLALPFAILAVGVALNLFLGGWETDKGFLGLRIHVPGFLLTAVIIGGMAFLNTWDILPAFVLLLGAYLLYRTRQSGWGWERLAETLEFGFSLGVAAIILYLPFFVGFSSQLGGILPNLVSPTRGAHLWVMFGSLLLPLLAYLVYLGFKEKIPARWGRGISLALGIALLLWGLSWLMAWLISRIDPATAQAFLDAQGVKTIAQLFTEASQRRWETIGGTLTTVVVLGIALGYFLGALGKQRKAADATSETDDSNPTDHCSLPTFHSPAFILLLIIIGALLILGPDFLYLRDQFGWRMNTVFKFYYQAWLLWSLAAAYGVAVMLQDLRKAWDILFRIGLTIVLLVALVYPVLGFLDKTRNLEIRGAVAKYKECRAAQADDCLAYALTSWDDWTLDGAAYLRLYNPDDAAAIDFLMQAQYGVVAEAVGGSYSSYARISTHTGLPTVIGWPGHESQWRGTGEGLSQREQDIRTLYETKDWVLAQEIITRYGIRYIVVGSLERDTYEVNEAKFQQVLREVFRAGGLVIYEVP